MDIDSLFENVTITQGATQRIIKTDELGRLPIEFADRLVYAIRPPGMTPLLRYGNGSNGAPLCARPSECMFALADDVAVVRLTDGTDIIAPSTASVRRDAGGFNVTDITGENYTIPETSVLCVRFASHRQYERMRKETGL